ncbi:DUF6942 family protein [Marinobacterium aestuarii]|uniref:DUF6942 family protein n=1 Tax=Marinobacterium aestuarii TaxID=1821621 RepID=UPI0012FFCA70|nr:hypothetical protein [Marinobacterium aestuarii]
MTAPQTSPQPTDEPALLGAPGARLALYLPNPPLILASEHGKLHPDIPDLIRHNGNHWRKIFSILAKLGTPADCRWQDYRDLELLHRHEVICFADGLLPTAQWHLVAGKASWQRLGFDPGTFSPLDDEGRVLIRGNILLTPYPDYRQFPNRTVEQVRSRLER